MVKLASIVQLHNLAELVKIVIIFLTTVTYPIDQKVKPSKTVDPIKT